MEGRYIAVYKVYGIANLPADQELELITRSNPHVRAFLTANVDVHCTHLDRAAVLGNTLLSFVFGGAGGGDVTKSLEAGIASRREARNKEGPGVFLILTAVGDLGEPNFSQRAERDDFVVCLDAIDKSYFRDRLRPIVTDVLAAIALCLPDNRSREIKFVGDVTYLIEPSSEKPIYSFTFVGSASATVSGPVNDRWAQSVEQCSQRFMADRRLATIARLLVQSQEFGTSNLRAFISAWSALEVFVNVAFKDSYEQQWLGLLRAGTPTTARRYFDRLRDVMRDKYRLVDKFVVVASLLDETTAEADIDTFRQLKDTRDEFFHSMEIGEAKLPTEAVQMLLRKYLRLHIDRPRESPPR